MEEIKQETMKDGGVAGSHDKENALERTEEEHACRVTASAQKGACTAQSV